MAGIELVANNAGLVSAMESSREAISSVATAAEAARQKMAASWRAQITAAEEAGASQAQLAKITSKFTAFIANTTEDSVKRTTKAADDYVASLEKMRAAASTLAIPAAPFAPDTSPEGARELAAAVEGVTEAHVHGVAPAVQFGSVIRSMEGNFSRNVRAAEIFGSSIGALQPIIAAAFPVVGAITLGYAIFEMGKNAYDAFEKIQKLSEVIKTGFDAMNLAADLSNDEMQLANDKLRNEIDKLQGKPQNNLAISIDETRIAADKLADSIKKSNDNVNELLSKNHLTDWAILIGKRGTSDREGTVKYYSDQQNEASLRQQLAIKNGDQAGADKALQDLHNSKNSELQNMLRDINSQQVGAKYGAGNGTDNINIDRGVAAQILAEQNKEKQLRDDGILAAQKQKEEDQKNSATRLKEAQKKAFEDQQKQWGDDLKSWQASWVGSGPSASEAIAGWWTIQAVHYSLGAENFKFAMKAANEQLIDINKDTAKRWEEFNKAVGQPNEGPSFLPEWVSEQERPDPRPLDASGKANAAWITNLRKRFGVNDNSQNSFDQAAIQLGVQTGAISKQDAAVRLATLHTKEYKQQRAELDRQLAAVNDMPIRDAERRERVSGIKNQRDQLEGQRSIQEMQDQQAINPVSSLASVGFVDALNDLVASARDAATQLREITSSTLNSVNGEIVKAISGQRTNWGNAGAGIFRNVAGVGLQKAEGSILGGLGFGGKADGSRSNPLYVRMADSVGSAASHLASSIGSKSGGLLGGLINLLPHFAAGGPISANTLSVVGENGPELFNPGMSGSIIPNHALSSIGGSGGDTHTWYIDATGSTDPAQTAAQVQRGIQYAAPHIVAASQRASSEKAKRTPSSKR